jgi:DNA-binding NtrC family response regulator
MQGLKILLVDDEFEFVSTLAERLGLRGFDVTTASSGEKALQLIAEETPHLVVLDLRMPGIGGREVLARLAAEHPRLPIILLTGLGSPEHSFEELRGQAFACMIKPVDIDDLIAKIGDAVAGKSANGGAE